MLKTSPQEGLGFQCQPQQVWSEETHTGKSQMCLSAIWVKMSYLCEALCHSRDKYHSENPNPLLRIMRYTRWWFIKSSPQVSGSGEAGPISVIVFKQAGMEFCCRRRNLKSPASLLQWTRPISTHLHKKAKGRAVCSLRLSKPTTTHRDLLSASLCFTSETQVCASQKKETWKILQVVFSKFDNNNRHQGISLRTLKFLMILLQVALVEKWKRLWIFVHFYKNMMFICLLWKIASNFSVSKYQVLFETNRKWRNKYKKTKAWLVISFRNFVWGPRRWKFQWFFLWLCVSPSPLVMCKVRFTPACSADQRFACIEHDLLDLICCYMYDSICCCLSSFLATEVDNPGNSSEWCNFDAVF